MNDNWDVIVVGAGTAGIPTALFAADRGARVLLIEAAPDVGGALHMSSGSLAAAGHRLQAEQGIDDSPERHFADSMRINHGTGDHAKLRLWQDEAAATLDWLLQAGLPMGKDQPAFNPAHEPYDVARIYSPPQGGISILECLRSELDRRVAEGRIELRCGTRMTALLPGQNGAIAGLKVETAEDAYEIRGRNIVLATGGYAHNEALWRELHDLPKRVYAYEHCRGDGLIAARQHGAQIAHAEHFLPTVGGTRDIDASDIYWIHTRNAPTFRTPWEIAVNLRGCRFMAEDKRGPDRRERALMAQPELCYWIIYDEAIRRAAPPFFLWPDEKVARAFAEDEDFQRAGNIAELADACGLPAEALATTVARYNAGQKVGSDEFGRQHLPLPIAEPPFYAVKHHGVAVITFAGLATDAGFQVLGSDDRPIGNVYAVGEILGAGVFGNAYLGGMMVGAGLTFGRLLGDRILTW